jgi:hypothetical protein
MDFVRFLDVSFLFWELDLAVHAYLAVLAYAGRARGRLCVCVRVCVRVFCVCSSLLASNVCVLCVPL